AADLDVVVQERDELRPGVLPQPADRRIHRAPLLRELLEPRFRGSLGRCRVDRAQVTSDLVPVLARRELNVLRIRWMMQTPAVNLWGESVVDEWAWVNCGRGRRPRVIWMWSARGGQRCGAE